MGGSKRAAEDHEAQFQRALAIAVEANVVTECEYHDGVYFEGNEPIEEAYKLGNTQFTAGELKGIFGSRREMTDLILAAVRDNSGDECYACQKHRDE